MFFSSGTTPPQQQRRPARTWGREQGVCGGGEGHGHHGLGNPLTLELMGAALGVLIRGSREMPPRGGFQGQSGPGGSGGWGVRWELSLGQLTPGSWGGPSGQMPALPKSLTPQCHPRPGSAERNTHEVKEMGKPN